MLKKMIIEECKKYGFEFSFTEERNKCLVFRNTGIREELSTFAVIIDEDLERVSMAILIDLGSWNDATESDINDIDDIIENINLWLSEESLKEVEKYFLEEEVE